MDRYGTQRLFEQLYYVLQRTRLIRKGCPVHHCRSRLSIDVSELLNIMEGLIPKGISSIRLEGHGHIIKWQIRPGFVTSERFDWPVSDEQPLILGLLPFARRHQPIGLVRSILWNRLDRLDRH